MRTPIPAIALIIVSLNVSLPRPFGISNDVMNSQARQLLEFITQTRGSFLKEIGIEPKMNQDNILFLNKTREDVEKNIMDKKIKKETLTLLKKKVGKEKTLKMKEKKNSKRNVRAASDEAEDYFSGLNNIVDTVIQTANEFNVTDRLKEEVGYVVDLERLDTLVKEGGEVIKPGLEAVGELVEATSGIGEEGLEEISPKIQSAGEKISQGIDLKKLEALVVEGGELIEPGIQTVKELVEMAGEIGEHNVEIVSPVIKTTGEKISQGLTSLYNTISSLFA